MNAEPSTLLNAHERDLVQALASHVIPPSADGRMPGAGDYDIASYLCEHGPADVPELREEIDTLDQLANRAYSRSFAELETAEQGALLTERRAGNPRYLYSFAKQVMACYYQQDAVLIGLGMEARAPFPKGFTVHAGDLRLLEPVKARGKVYRDVD